MGDRRQLLGSHGGGHLMGPLVLCREPELPMEAATKQYVDTLPVHDLRVRASDALNGAVSAGGLLQFDTVDFDSAGYTPAALPFDTLTIPPGLAGIYIFAAWSASTGNQSTSMGMGILVNTEQRFSQTNQTIYGPAAINYTLDNGAVEILRLADGDTLHLINNSVSPSPSVFTSVTLSMARLGASYV